MRFDAEKMWDRIPKTPVCFLGWGLISVWSNLMYVYPVGNLSELPSVSRIIFDSVLIVSMTIVAILARLCPRFAPLVHQKWARPVAVCFLEFCVCVTFYGALSHNAAHVQALLWAALVVGGIGTALLMLLLSEFFGYIHPKRTILYMASGWLVGSILAFFLRVLPLSYLCVCMLAIPIVVVLCLWRAYHTLSESEQSFMSSSKYSFPWLPLLPILLFAIIKRGLNVLVPIGLTSQTISDLGMVSAALVVLGGLTLFGGNLNLRSLWKISVGSMAVAVVLFVGAAFGTGVVWGTASALASSMAYYLIFLLMTAIFANMSYRWGVCALWLFAIEQASHMLVGTASALGMDWLLAASVVPRGAIDVVLVVISVVALLVVAYLFRRYSPDSLWGLTLSGEGSYSESEQLHRACEKVGSDFSLTPREREILFMLLQDKKPTTIAEELFIEVSTTRTHIKHIYTKLDIHSHKELMVLLDATSRALGQS